MATIMEMVQILTKTIQPFQINKKGHDWMDCLMVMQLTYFLVLKDYILYYHDICLML